MKKHVILITIIGLFLLMLSLMAGAETVDSGTCGEGLSWELDNQGVLRISGTGTMDDYDVVEGCDEPFTTAPWGMNRDKITSVVIASGNRKIGRSAFLGCKKIKEIILPESLEIINSSAFARCTELASIIIPNNVTNIQSVTFANCSSLENIILPQNLLSISDNVWYPNNRYLDHIY